MTRPFGFAILYLDKVDMNWYNQKTKNLFNAILQIKNPDEARRFFRDLLTEEELIEFSKRWQAAQMLDRKISYEKIEKETGLSSRTIARVAKFLNGKNNGYKKIINKIHHSSSVQKRRGLS